MPVHVGLDQEENQVRKALSQQGGKPQCVLDFFLRDGAVTVECVPWDALDCRLSIHACCAVSHEKMVDLSVGQHMGRQRPRCVSDDADERGDDR